MKLMSLDLRNFKGVSSLHLDFGGRDAAVCGDNGSGKTTVYDAFLWLLFGKDSTGRKDFEIKPLGPDGHPAWQGIEVRVEAGIEHEGEAYRLERTYVEKWVRPRGSAQAALTGHETRYAVDGVPYTQGQYQAFIDQIIPESLFRLLIHPYAFHALKWTERRAVLFDMLGEITDRDVLDAVPALSPLADALGNYTVEAYRKVLAARHKSLNGELRVLPARIDEAGRQMPEAEDTEALRAQIIALTEEKAAAQARMQTANTAVLREEEAALRSQMHRLDAEQHALAQEARTAWESGRRERMTSLHKELDALVSPRYELEQAACRTEDLRRELQRARKTWEDVQAERFAGGCACPTCGRAFAPEDVQAQAAAFTADRNARLQELAETGRKLAEKLDEAEAAQVALQEQVRAVEARQSALRAQIKGIQLETFVPPSVDHTEMDALQEQVSVVWTRIKAAESREEAANQQVTAQVKALDAEIQALQERLAGQKTRRDALARLAELEAQQRTLAAELEAVERMQALCEDFLRAKVGLVQERVNAHFTLVRWKLYDQQINGGLADCCEATVGGVPWADLNHAAQIHAGLDIIRALGARYGKAAPVFVDNAESVTSLPPMECQVIRLVVSSGDKQLRLQIEEE